MKTSYILPCYCSLDGDPRSEAFKSEYLHAYLQELL